MWRCENKGSPVSRWVDSWDKVLLGCIGHVWANIDKVIASAIQAEVVGTVVIMLCLGKQAMSGLYRIDWHWLTGQKCRHVCRQCCGSSGVVWDWRVIGLIGIDVVSSIEHAARLGTTLVKLVLVNGIVEFNADFDKLIKDSRFRAHCN